MLATMPRRSRAQGPERVLDAICTLGERHDTLPTQGMVAEHMGVSQQYISAMMRELEYRGLIEWISQRVYRVVNGNWERIE